MCVDLLQFNILIKIGYSLFKSSLKCWYLIAKSAFLHFARLWILQLHLKIFYSLWGLVAVVRELLDFTTTFLTWFDLILFLLNLLQLWLVFIRVLNFLSIADWQNWLISDAKDLFDVGFWIFFTAFSFARTITDRVVIYILYI